MFKLTPATVCSPFRTLQRNSYSRCHWTITCHNFSDSFSCSRFGNYIEYYLSVLVYRCLSGLPPSYFSDDLFTDTIIRRGRTISLPIIDVPSPLPLLVSGTVCQSVSHRHHGSSLSMDDQSWKCWSVVIKFYLLIKRCALLVCWIAARASVFRPPML